MLEDIGNLTLDTKSEALEMYLKQSIIEELKRISTCKWALFLAKKFSEGSQFVRKSPKTEDMRKIILEKLYEFKDDAKSPNLYIQPAIALSSGIEDSWPFDMGLLTGREIN